MQWLSGNRNTLPLKAIDHVLVGKRIIAESMDLIIKTTNNGTGGLIAVMKTKKNQLYAIPMDPLCGYRPSKEYNSSYLDSRIRETVTIIQHASSNPEPYNLQSLGIKNSDRLAAVAMATPIDLQGIVAPDGNAYGWEVVAVAGSGVEFDFTLFGGHNLGGSISLDMGKIFKSEEIPELRYGIRKGHQMSSIFRALSSGVPTGLDLTQTKFYLGKSNRRND